jgi:hypothetical protein
LGYTSLNIDFREKTVKKKRIDYKEMIEPISTLLENPSESLLNFDFKIYRQISVDIPRTLPAFKLFSNEKIQKIMLRILFIWATKHKNIGYVQGFNDMCTPFIIVFLAQYIDIDMDNLNNFDENNFKSIGFEELFEIEADSYWCFSLMMNKIQNNYTSNQSFLQEMVEKLEGIIKIIDPDIIEHFEKQDLKFLQFSFRWMNCFLMREFSLKIIIRLWDTYFSEDNAFNNFHVFVCAGLLLSFSEKIKSMEFQELIIFLQNMPTDVWTLEDIDVLLAKTYQINILYGKVVK